MSLIILNFHGVGPVTREIDAGERNCWLDQDQFATVLDLVRDRPNIQLTVDDGNASDVELILPALLSRGLKATFFVCSGRLDQPTFLSRAQVQELQAKGMIIGSHGVDHLPWRTLSGAQLNDELAQSKAVLEKVCTRPIDRAACPFGSYDRRVLANLRRLGYEKVYTSDEGKASAQQWVQARTTITRSIPISEIKNLVQNGPSLLKQASINTRKLIKRLR